MNRTDDKDSQRLYNRLKQRIWYNNHKEQKRELSRKYRLNKKQCQQKR